MSVATVTTLPEFRVSKAALGRRLASVILRSQEAGLSPEEFTHTVSAVLESCTTGDFDDDNYPCAHTEILETEHAEVKKSIRRSEIARKAATRRRELKEQRIKALEEEKKSVDTQIDNTAIETVETPDPEKLTETASPTAPEDSDSTSPTDSTNSRKRRRRRRRRKSNI